MTIANGKNTFISGSIPPLQADISPATKTSDSCNCHCCYRLSYNVASSDKNGQNKLKEKKVTKKPSQGFQMDENASEEKKVEVSASQKEKLKVDPSEATSNVAAGVLHKKAKKKGSCCFK